jgi:hypothetical protein
VISKPEYAEALDVIEVVGIPVTAFAGQKGLSSSNAGVRVFRALEAMKERVTESCGACAAHLVSPQARVIECAPSDYIVQRSFSFCPARMGDIERSIAGGTS